MATILTRAARADDAAEAIALLRRSIVELCVADHRNDEATLQARLHNKTVDRFARWLADADTKVIVAEHTDAIRGVGSIHRSGEIRLCYVLPGFQAMGIGRALLTLLEQQACAWGLEHVHLDSSTGARAFYERSGYRATGAAEPGHGITFRYPYGKTLT